ncbi:MAG TPA: nitrite reductase small subunit NirD [Bryobacteraceae bacterium]|jgi:nitrite reductase (NADH) small subunit|nr:nitrite reductase small subunit NirD [Bryobacteraceae bacterium]
MNWIRVTSTESIPVREGRCVDLGDREVAIFNLGNDKLKAIDAACPHRGGPLCDGIVTGTGAPSLVGGVMTGNAVVCPLHGWKIDLETGRVLKPEVSVRVDAYEVRVREGIVEIAIPDAAGRGIAA